MIGVAPEFAVGYVSPESPASFAVRGVACYWRFFFGLGYGFTELAIHLALFPLFGLGDWFFGAVWQWLMLGDIGHTGICVWSSR